MDTQNNFKAGIFFDDLNQVEVGFKNPAAPASGNGQLWAKDLIRGTEAGSGWDLQNFSINLNLSHTEDASLDTDIILMAPMTAYADDPDSEPGWIWIYPQDFSIGVNVPVPITLPLEYGGVPGKPVDIDVIIRYPYASLDITSTDPLQDLDYSSQTFDVNGYGLSIGHFVITAGQDAAINIILKGN